MSTVSWPVSSTPQVSLSLGNPFSARPPRELLRIGGHVGAVDHEVDEVVGGEPCLDDGIAAARVLDDVLRERRRDELALGPQRRDELRRERREVAARAHVGATLEIDVDAVEVEPRDERVEVGDERARCSRRSDSG